ncbi:MAG: metallophosphoesterase [Mogibacterium sp.]|nr:metallophosphoesterase [Mogibacterium sp.]MBQ6500942.1 metallophosphoesterase [Mogibacterium sp.]
MERGKSKNRIKVLILLVLLLACVAASAYIFKLGKAAEDADLSAQNTDEAAVQTEENVDPAAVIFTASDYQADPNFDMPEQTLRELLKAVSEDGLTPDAALICGDYTNDAKLHDYQLSPEDSIAEIRSVLEEEAPSVKSDDVIFVQGNHDRLTESISESGLHEFDSYLVYVLNTENDFPWKQGVTPGCLKKVTEASEAMKDCLDSLIAQGETRPLIITGHVPLHYTARTSSRHTTGDNLYSSLIFDVVNEAAADLDIIYLFGHNHSKGWDCYLGGSSVYKAPGDTILLPVFDETRVTTDEFTEKTLAFTYMNAGYTGYYMNCGPGEYSSDPDSQYRAADETLTCSVISIYNDRIEISRYDENGQHDMGSAGEADPYKGGIDDGLIGTEYYSKVMPGTAVIKIEDNINKKSTN